MGRIKCELSINMNYTLLMEIKPFKYSANSVTGCHSIPGKFLKQEMITHNQLQP